MAAGDVIVISEDGSGKKGVYFDGTDDYILADAHAVARVAANDTIGTYTAWIYKDDTTTQQAILSAGDNNSADEYLYFHVRDGCLRIKLKQGAATQWEVKEATASMAAKTWYHVALVQDGTQPKLYINGEELTTTNETATDLTMWYDELANCDKFAIGVLESNATHTQDWKGAIGQVKYWSQALTADELQRDIRVETTLSDDSVRDALLTASLQFNLTMEHDGTTDSGLGADNGTLTGNAHYGGVISDHSYAVEANSTGHAAEFINTFQDGNKRVSIIKRGD